MGEPWGVCCEDLGENWLCYNTVLICKYGEVLFKNGEFTPIYSIDTLCLTYEVEIWSVFCEFKGWPKISIEIALLYST